MADEGLKAGGNGEKYMPWNAEQKQYVKLRIQGYSIKAAAEEVGVHENTGSNWESRPQLNMKAAIAAGIQFKQGLGSAEAVAQVSETIDQVCQEVTGHITLPLVLTLLEKRNAAEAIVTTAMNIMEHSKSDFARLKAVEIVAEWLGVNQQVKMSQTQSTTVITPGLSADGQDAIERDLLGIQVRDRIWETIKAESVDAES